MCEAAAAKSKNKKPVQNRNNSQPVTRVGAKLRNKKKKKKENKRAT